MSRSSPRAQSVANLGGRLEPRLLPGGDLRWPPTLRGHASDGTGGRPHQAPHPAPGATLVRPVSSL